MKPTHLTAPLTRRDLDDILADLEPGESLGLTPSCHPRAAAHVSYEGGSLVLSCAQCDQFMIAIAVRSER